jgi:hypothetical protein
MKKGQRTTASPEEPTINTPILMTNDTHCLTLELTAEQIGHLEKYCGRYGLTASGLALWLIISGLIDMDLKAQGIEAA